MYRKAAKAISLVLVILLLGSVPVYGWYERGVDPGGGVQFGPGGGKGETDPDDFPITVGVDRYAVMIDQLGGPGAVLKSAARTLGILPF